MIAPILTPNQVSKVKEKVLNQPPDGSWFKNLYAQPFRVESVPYSEVLLAFDRSEQTFRQFPVDERRVKTLATEIFHKDGALYEPISLGELGGELYGIGGRHRCHAIGEVLKSLNGDERLISEPLIPCLVYQFNARNELVRAIELDNRSRSMTQSELSSLHAQYLGVDLDDFDSVPETMKRARSQRDNIVLFANAFRMAVSLEAIVPGVGRRVLSPDTLLTLGKAVGSYLNDFKVPRPSAPKESQYVDPEHFRRDLDAWEQRFPVPSTEKLMLSPEDKLSLLEWLECHIQEFLDVNPLQSSLVAREVVRSEYLHGLLMYLDGSQIEGRPLHQYLEELSFANQERAAKEKREKANRASAKGKKMVSLFSEALAGADLSGMSPEQIADLLQSVLSQ